MTAKERDARIKEEWRIIEMMRPRFENWLSQQSFANKFHQMEFFPDGGKLEVIVFYETDIDVAEGQKLGFSAAIREQLIIELLSVGGAALMSLDFQFEFDSHENVLKNYQGSYFYRRRA